MDYGSQLVAYKTRAHGFSDLMHCSTITFGRVLRRGLPKGSTRSNGLSLYEEGIEENVHRSRDLELLDTHK